MWLREFANSYFVTVNRRLNEKLWDGSEMLPEVREKLFKIAEKFEEFVGVDLPVIDYTVTGSNANFTWTKFSDIDLHLVIEGDVTDEQRELYSAKKALWAEHHEITIRGIPVECYIQGENEPHHSTGVYSIKTGTWVVTPQKSKPSLDDAAVKRKLDSISHDASAALASGNIDKIESINERIKTMRKAGLERAGEWSVENVVFKTLRSMGIIDRIHERIRELEDRELSLESKHN